MEDLLVGLFGKKLNCHEAKRISTLDVKDAKRLRDFVDKVELRFAALSWRFEFVDSCNGLAAGTSDGKALTRCSTR